MYRAFEREICHIRQFQCLFHILQCTSYAKYEMVTECHVYDVKPFLKDSLTLDSQSCPISVNLVLFFVSEGNLLYWVYRLPDGNVDVFIEEPERLNYSLTERPNYEVNILRDVNINLNKIRDPVVKKYKDFLRRNQLIFHNE